MNFKAIFRLSPLRCKGDEATGRRVGNVAALDAGPDHLPGFLKRVESGGGRGTTP